MNKFLIKLCSFLFVIGILASLSQAHASYAITTKFQVQGSVRSVVIQDPEPIKSPPDPGVETNTPIPTYSPELIDALTTYEGGISPAQKLNADKLISYFENGTFTIQYAYVEALGDGRGYTVGRGFTTGTGDAYEVIKLYTNQVPNNPLAKYLPRLKVLANRESGSIAGLSGFPKAWRNASLSPKFRQIQDTFSDKQSYNVATDLAKKSGLRTPLSIIALYDTVVMHGSGTDKDSAESLIKRTHQFLSGMSYNESQWLSAFLKIRRADLVNPYNKSTKKEWSQAAYRADVFSCLLQNNDLGFETPVGTGCLSIKSIDNYEAKQ